MNEEQETGKTLPDIISASVYKERKSPFRWTLSFRTSDDKKHSVYPSSEDLSEYFKKAKGVNLEELFELRKELAGKYLTQAMDNTKSNDLDLSKTREDKALDIFAEMMIEKIESIQQDWKKPWFTEGSLSMPKNLSGREYNGMNSLMLMMQCEKQGYELPFFATHDRLNSLNYTKGKQGELVKAKDKNGELLPIVHVNKGEKSFPVFITTFTVVNPETKEKIKYDDYRQMPEEERNKYNVYPKLKAYSVFNVAQTNIKEARPELYAKLEQQNNPSIGMQMDGKEFSFPAIDRMIKDNEWICPIKPTYGDDAYYSISKNEIVIPEKKQFKDGESFYSNLAHEMAHSTGAESQLNRLKPTSFGSKEYAREELIAELTAALTCQRYGMQKNLKDDSAAYLKSWLDSLHESPKFIQTVLMDVKKASHMISSEVEKVQMKIDAALAKVKEQSETQQQSQKHEESKQQTVKELGTYEIPEWAIPYIFNGDADGITDEEQEMVDKFLEEKFPDGFIPEVVEGSERANSVTAAFGERNPNALPNKGESPYVVQSTVEVKFSAAGTFEISNGKDQDEDKSLQIVVDNTKEQSETISVAEEARKNKALNFKEVLMLKFDAKNWLLCIRPEGETAFGIKPSYKDISLYFEKVKGNPKTNETEKFKNELARKYYAEATKDPSKKIDIFKSNVEQVIIDQVQNTFIFSHDGTNHGKKLIRATVHGNKLKAKPLSLHQQALLSLTSDSMHQRALEKQIAAELCHDEIKEITYKEAVWFENVHKKPLFSGAEEFIKKIEEEQKAMNPEAVQSIDEDLEDNIEEEEEQTRSRGMHR